MELQSSNQSSDSSQLQFADGTSRAFQPGMMVRDLLSDTERKNIIGIKVAGERLDLTSPLTSGGAASWIPLQEDTEDTRYLYRHSFSHILAQAVKRLYPEAKFAIGPAIADGFYYDIDVAKPFTPEDLEKISAEMEKIIGEKHRFERMEMSYDDALAYFRDQGEIYKVELLEGIQNRGESITFYKDGEYVDLCRGPHVPTTGYVKHFKLLEIAGAYWRGDEKNKMLQRIYGTAFYRKEDLEKYLWQLEEAKKRDHRKLGKELDLFSVNPDTVGAGLILWHPKGGLIRHLMEEHCKRRHLENGYDFVNTPHIGKSTLWETSGHLAFYKDGMYAPLDIDGQEYYLKPMNCPFHVQIFNSKIRSYRDLPQRFAEWGTVYRWERSGTLHGLSRVRGFTQDDAHLFCRPDQMPAEIDKVLDFCLSILRDFGFDEFELALSTRPKERVGREEDWDAAETALHEALKRMNLPFYVNEGDGAFYGPKIDIRVSDAVGRAWQLSTIQFDFNLPERFDLGFIGEDGATHRPFMIHRALMGSVERFFGILIEHYAGAFPVWLSPVQAMVLPITDKQSEASQAVVQQLLDAGIRAEIDGSSNTLNYRIRAAQGAKIPYMLVMGDREIAASSVSVRPRTGDDLGVMSVADFITFAKDKIATKAVL